MTALEQLAAAYVLNAVWQLPVLILTCVAILRLARGVTARVRYAAWLGCVAAAALLPASVVLGLFAPASLSQGEAATGASPPLVGRVLLFVWMAGAIFHLARLLRAALASARARSRTSAPHAPPAASVPILISPPDLAPMGPLLLGLFRPAILIPRPLLDPDNSRLLEAAIAHETAHVERGDMLTLALSELMLTPLAFHPAAGWLRRQLTDTRELACDELVSRHRLHPREYARCLIDLARTVVAAPIASLGVGDGRNLEKRIRALLEGVPVRVGRVRGCAAILATVIISGVLAVAARSVYLWAAPMPSYPSLSVSLFVPAPPPPPPPPRRR